MIGNYKKYNSLINDFFSHLQLASKNKKLYFYFPKTKFSENLIKKLVQENILYGFEQLNVTKQKGACFKIWIRHSFRNSSSNTVVKKIKPLYSFSRKMFYSLFEIQSFHYSEFPKILYLTTSKGILTHVECLKYNIGGIALFYVEF